MPLTNAYDDEYLRPLVTEARETRATADVASLGTLPAAWSTRLVILRAYIITCIDCMRADGDTFHAKLRAYRTEYDQTLQLARAAQATIDAGTGSGGGGMGSLFGVVELWRA